MHSTLLCSIQLHCFILHYINTRNPQSSILLRRRANDRNVSFSNSLRRLIYLYQLQVDNQLAILHELLRSLSFANSSAFQRSLFLAMFLVAFYGLFRIGELASKSTRFARSVVQYSNLTFSFGEDHNGQPQGAKITISEYKHNASQKPFDILLARDFSSPFCPVIALFQYCKVRGDRPGPLFCHTDETSISFISSMSHFRIAYLIVV